MIDYTQTATISAGRFALFALILALLVPTLGAIDKGPVRVALPLAGALLFGWFVDGSPKQRVVAGAVAAVALFAIGYLAYRLGK